MQKKTFMINLDKEVAEEAEAIIKRQGGKKSGLLNYLLNVWVLKQLDGMDDLTQEQKELKEKIKTENGI